VETFSSAAEFLEHERDDAPCCLVLDVQLPDQSGVELQQTLSELAFAPPIVFVTGHGDIPMTAKAMRTGAIDFLCKPIDSDELLSAVRRGIAKDEQVRRERSLVEDIRRRYETLSVREREVLGHVVAGRLNKQIGQRLGVTEKTIKVHRGQVMKKMGVASLAELVRMAHAFGIDGPGGQAPGL
jgi:FixJ family two-component response regulator